MQEAAPPQLDLDGEIWRFALEFYGASGVSETCLRMQDEAGLDVVAAIVILYAEAKLHRRLTAGQVQQLQSDMKSWRDETVLPLRDLRRRLKAPPSSFPAAETEGLRNLIKKAELRSEQIQLAMGEHWLATLPALEGLAVEAALGLLLNPSSGTLPGDATTLIEHLVKAATKAAAGS